MKAATIISFVLFSFGSLSQVLIYETGEGTQDPWTNWHPELSENCYFDSITDQNSWYFECSADSSIHVQYWVKLVKEVNIIGYNKLEFIYSMSWSDNANYAISVSQDLINWDYANFEYSTNPNGVVDTVSILISTPVNYIRIQQSGSSLSQLYYQQFNYLKMYGYYNVGLEENQDLLEKKGVKIIDPILGREVPYSPNTFLIYVYDDGSRTKMFTVE